MYNEKVWKDGENQVCEYLKEKRYKIVYQNFSCKIAELDIVAVLPKHIQKKNLKMQSKQKIINAKTNNEKALIKFALKNQLKNLRDMLVVVEVKSRSNNKFGLGLEAITGEKMFHMKRGAEVLLKMKKFKNMQVRFDVASVDSGKITYLEGAF